MANQTALSEKRFSIAKYTDSPYLVVVPIPLDPKTSLTKTAQVKVGTSVSRSDPGHKLYSKDLVRLQLPKIAALCNRN